MVTIKDVARIAGVSIATVSRTLSKPESVSENTQEKVNKAIAKSGYVTNALASNFRRRQSNTIVVIVPNIGNSFYAAVIQGIEKVAAANGYRVLLGDSQFRQGRESEYAEMVRQRLADGMICLGRNVPIDTRTSIEAKDAPPVVMACEYQGPISVPSVVIDNQLAAKEMTQYLIKQGHHRIGFINGPDDMPICQARFQGYLDALSEAKIRSSKGLVASGEFLLAEGYNLAHKMLSAKNPPTAIFCASDEMAVGAMNAAADLGLNVPADVSIAGFDDIEVAEYCRPALTTVHQPRTAIGEKAMLAMLQVLKGNEAEVSRTVLPHHLVIRSSVGKPKKSS